MNTITATIEFNFKGETLPPMAELDLEIILGEDVQFSNAKGRALTFFQDRHFDQKGFEQHPKPKSIIMAS